MYNVSIKRKTIGNAEKLPENVKVLFKQLVNDLINSGPVQTSWPHYSKLSKNTYHCHLGYHHVSCWRCENESIEIEVYYVGSREDAPY